MPETTRKPPNYGRRIVWLGVFVVVVVAVYSAGWLYLARIVESKANATLASMRDDGIDARCSNAEARGYPFRIGLFCDEVGFADAAKNASLSAGAFRSAGQIYDPLRLVAELDGPASVTAPGIGPVALNWRELRASARLADPLPTRISIEGAAFKAQSADGKPLLSADVFEGHMRPDERDIDLAFRLGGLVVDPAFVGGRVLPALSGEGDVTVKDGVRLIVESVKDLHGQAGTIRNLSLSLGGNESVAVSGPIAIGEDGLIDAELMLNLRDPKALEQALTTVFPERTDQITQGFKGLAFLGAQPSLPLKIARGKASLGFLPLGDIPAIE